MPYDINIREEELKNKVAQDYFWIYDTTKIIGNVDFCIAMHQAETELFEQESLLWAEAKKGVADIYTSLVQLILTIGKARTFDKYLPPAMLGAFDAEKIAFVPYNDVQDIFYQNDFNWNVTPSNYESKEFKLVLDKVKNILDQNALLYFYDKDDKELRKFIKTNFIVGKFGFTKTRIDKNNFISIYNKWLQTVKPTIAVNWEVLKTKGIIDGDFYLADLLSLENETIKDKLFVLLKKNKYELDRILDDTGLFNTKSAEFTDNQKAHTQFWNKYERPPLEQYWDYIVERRDLLVPQDVRERKGSFFTPQIWVELSQKYLKDVLGDDWQDEYYIWDCAAGTGNLLNGFTNKYNLWASTLDKQDVDVMKDRIKNGANLLEDHVFQFDFLNDDFIKLPKKLKEIIDVPEKRKKLVVYINPPYAEAGSVSVNDKRKNKTNVATQSQTWNKYQDKLGLAIRELYAQFFIRINNEISDCILASFSTLKYISGDGFDKFRVNFLATFVKGFIIPANTFDNVSGSFPIGFLIWNLFKKFPINQIQTDVYDNLAKKIGSKNFYTNIKSERITNWIKQYDVKKSIDVIGYTGNNGPDFQNNNYCLISSKQKTNKNGVLNNATKYCITKNNLIVFCVYYSVRHCIKSTWLNDRDQFLYPNEEWEKDKEFQTDCLAFALFHGQNRITSKEGTNLWIPFTENEVNAREKFDSNFMSQFIKGKIKPEQDKPEQDKPDIFNIVSEPKVHYETPLKFSNEAKAVFDAGRELWKYYHTNFSKVLNFGKVEFNVNASLYDIREYFQGRNESGKMNNKSIDQTYTKLIADLRDTLKLLAEKIEPKVYEYEFLKE
jgi:hypothetical protein